MKIYSLTLLLVVYLGFPRFSSQQSPVCGTLSDDNYFACLNLASSQIESICGLQPAPTVSDSSARRFYQCMCTNLVLTINCFLQCPGQRIRMNQLKAEQTTFCDAAKPPPTLTTSTTIRRITTFSQPGTPTTQSNDTMIKSTTTAAMIQRPPLKTNHAAGDVQEPLAALVGGAMAAAAMLLG